jgi:hypothetical protein
MEFLPQKPLQVKDSFAYYPDFSVDNFDDSVEKPRFSAAGDTATPVYPYFPMRVGVVRHSPIFAPSENGKAKWPPRIVAREA